jgi:hypothetical protein
MATKTITNEEGTFTVKEGGAMDKASTPNTDEFIKQLQGKLLGQSDIISSQNTKLESKIQEAIQGVQTGQQAGEKVITSQFDRAIGQATQEGEIRKTGMLESQRGFASNTAALDKLNTDTQTQLKDLEQRKQELILQGQAAAAGQVSQLQMQAIQFQQQAQQQVFSNLLGMASFGLSAQQQRQQQSQFEARLNFDENSAMSNIALQYGLELQPGEDLKALYSRATKDMGANSPAALAIKEAQSTINRNNAEIARIQADAAKSGKVDDVDMEVIANAIAAQPAYASALLANVTDVSQQARILEMADNKTFVSTAKAARDNGDSKSDAKNEILSRTDISASQKATGLKALEEVYGPDSQQSQRQGSGFSSGLPQGIAGAYKGYANSVEAALSYIFGIQPNAPFK